MASLMNHDGIRNPKQSTNLNRQCNTKLALELGTYLTSLDYDFQMKKDKFIAFWENIFQLIGLMENPNAKCSLDFQQVFKSILVHVDEQRGIQGQSRLQKNLSINVCRIIPIIREKQKNELYDHACILLLGIILSLSPFISSSVASELVKSALLIEVTAKDGFKIVDNHLQSGDVNLTGTSTCQEILSTGSSFVVINTDLLDKLTYAYSQSFGRFSCQLNSNNDDMNHILENDDPCMIALFQVLLNVYQESILNFHLVNWKKSMDPDTQSLNISRVMKRNCSKSERISKKGPLIKLIEYVKGNNGNNDNNGNNGNNNTYSTEVDIDVESCKRPPSRTSGPDTFLFSREKFSIVSVFIKEAFQREFALGTDTYDGSGGDDDDADDVYHENTESNEKEWMNSVTSSRSSIGTNKLLDINEIKVDVEFDPPESNTIKIMMFFSILDSLVVSDKDLFKKFLFSFLIFDSHLPEYDRLVCKRLKYLDANERSDLITLLIQNDQMKHFVIRRIECAFGYDFIPEYDITDGDGALEKTGEDIITIGLNASDTSLRGDTNRLFIFTDSSLMSSTNQMNEKEGTLLDQSMVTDPTIKKIIESAQSI